MPAPPARRPPWSCSTTSATQSVADSGKVLPAATCIKAAGTNTSVFLPSAKSYYTVEGKQLAASANLSVPILYFDRTTFKAAGLDPTHPPQTLDEVYQDAVKLKQAAPTSVPLAMTESSWWVETWLTGAGSDIVNNNNGRSAPADGSTFNSAKSVAIHQWMQKMYAADLVDLVPDTGGQHDAELDLADRKSAMLFDSSTSIGDLDALMAGTLDPTTWNLPSVTVLPSPGPSLDLDVAPIPGLEFPGRGQVSGSAWYLTTNSSPATQAAAWTFLTWWNQPAQQAAWNLQGAYLPYNTQAVNRSGPPAGVAEHPQGSLARHRLHRDDQLRHPVAGPAHRSLLRGPGRHRAVADRRDRRRDGSPDRGHRDRPDDRRGSGRVHPGPLLRRLESSQTI